MTDAEAGSSPPLWWTGRGAAMFSGDANEAMRFARFEDAERARAWLVERGISRGCKSTERLWPKP